MGYGSEKTHTALELTYNYGRDTYDQGDWGHFCIGVPDVYKAADSIKSGGGKVLLPLCSLSSLLPFAGAALCSR